MQNHQSAQDYNLKQFTVAIRGDVEGTGVIVTDDGLILTCYHIIGNLKNRTLYSKTVDIYLPEAGLSQSADVIEKYCDPSIDVGFLRLQGKLPEQATAVAYLAETVYPSPKHKFKSFGFRKPDQFTGLFADVKIRGETRKISMDTTLSQDVIQLYSDEIGEGMSGSAVVDLDIDRVIGIVFEHNDTKSTVDAKLNFAIPIKSILKASEVSSELKEKNPGLNPQLSKISEFLDR